MSLFTPTGHLLPYPQFRQHLRDGADPNACFRAADLLDRTPLLLAVLQKASDLGHLHALLADKRTDLTIADIQGRNALHLACERGHEGVVRLLCHAGVAVNGSDIEGRRPIHYAIGPEISASQSVQVLRVLIEYGADINARNKSGRTALHEAMFSGSSFWHKPVDEKVACLLKARCAVDIQDKQGRTPMFLAAVTGHHRVVRALLATGANPELADREGYRPVDAVRRQIAEDSLGLDNHMGYFEDLSEVLDILVSHTRARLTQLSGSVVARTSGQSGALVRRM